MLKVLLALLLPLQVFAQWDLSLGAQLRSYPSLGGEAYVHTGYNFVFWGKGDKRNPLYGLIRPALELTSSGVINAINPRIEFYPISFLGVARGRQYIYSNYDEFTFFDCDTSRCKGSLDKDYTEFKMAMAFKGITAMGLVRISDNTYSGDESMPVAEFRSATLVNPGVEEEYYSQYVLGYQTKRSLIGAVVEYIKFDRSKQYYKSYLGIYNPRFGKTSLILGAGTFESSHQAKGFIAVFKINYDILPSKKLF